MLILIFFFPTTFFPHRREFSGICRRLNYCPNFVPCPWFLHFGFCHMLCFGQWDSVMKKEKKKWWKQRLTMHLYSPACLYAFQWVPWEVLLWVHCPFSLGLWMSTCGILLTQPTARSTATWLSPANPAKPQTGAYEDKYLQAIEFLGSLLCTIIVTRVDSYIIACHKHMKLPDWNSFRALVVEQNTKAATAS